MTDADERVVPVAIDGGTSSGVGGGVPTEAEMHAMIVNYAEGQGMEIPEADMALIDTEISETEMAAIDVSGETELEAQVSEELAEMEEWETEQIIGEGMEDQIIEQQEYQGDNMMNTEDDLVDAITAGMYIQMGLMEQDTDELWASLGGPTPAEIAQSAGLLTPEQVAWINEPFHTEAEMIAIIEGGITIQMFTEAELEEIGGEEYMIESFLREVGREDLMGNVIVLDEAEKQMIYDYRIGERGLEGRTHAEIIDSYQGFGGAGIRGTAGGGQLKRLLDTIQGDGTNRDDTGAIEDAEEDEREDWGCISGVIDDKTCGGCKSIIGTCGPMAELPDPPFHKNCRCGKHRA